MVLEQTAIVTPYDQHELQNSLFEAKVTFNIIYPVLIAISVHKKKTFICRTWNPIRM